MTAPIQISQENWARGYVIDGFKLPPIAGVLQGRLERHDPAAGVLRVSFPTKPEYANPGGVVMGGIVSAFLDDCMGPLVVAQTGGTKFPVSTDLHTQFFKGVPIGPNCMVEARIDRIGRNIVFKKRSGDEREGRGMRQGRPHRDADGRTESVTTTTPDIILS